MSVKKIACLLGLVFVFFSGPLAASLHVPMQWITKDKIGQPIGYITADDTLYGLLLTPHLKGLSPGTHGFHVHAVGLCTDEGRGAAGHFDPIHTQVHLGPYRGNGHLGDLPVLVVNEAGEAMLPVLAPRLKLSQIKGRALIIHAGTDDYSKDFQRLPHSGRRIACGVIPWH